jgi:Flp pilus assembly protein TadD
VKIVNNEGKSPVVAEKEDTAVTEFSERRIAHASSSRVASNKKLFVASNLNSHEVATKLTGDGLS